MNTHEINDDYLLEELKRRLEQRSNLFDSHLTLSIELEQVNERLKDVEQVKSKFLSNIRNEINNPLTAIIGLADQIKQPQVNEISQIKSLVDLIYEESKRLDFQLRNIFIAAEIEAGQLTPRPALVDIGEIIKSQTDYLAYKIKQRKVILENQGSTDRLFRTDPTMLQSILMNLISNAIEFSPSDQKVIITAAINNTSLTISVLDFGEGISLRNQKYIFDRFRQLDTGTTKSHEGHGLGLSIVHECTDALGGKIEIESEAGKSTCIRIVFPEFSPNAGQSGLSAGGEEILFGDEMIL